MAKKGFSIKYEQTTDMPLKISPKNTWVKINTFDTPCRLLEISTQSLNIEIKNLPEASTMQAGNNIKIQVLNASGEDPLVLHVTIFHINDTECLCQVPLYVDSEQILLDKIVLEIQKNEIGDKHFSSFARNNDNSDNAAEQNYNVATSDEDIASILNNLVAMLPNETKDRKKEETIYEGDHFFTVLNEIADTYDNLYARSSDPDRTIEGAPVKYGWHTNKRTKYLAYDTSRAIIREREYIERDRRCVDEMTWLETKSDGSLGAIEGQHDDIIDTTAIGIYISSEEMSLPRKIQLTQKAANNIQKTGGIATI